MPFMVYISHAEATCRSEADYFPQFILESF